MAFVRHPGVRGKIFIPDRTSKSLRKHDCKDCFFCQCCSDDRCEACLAPIRIDPAKSGCRCEPLMKSKDPS